MSGPYLLDTGPLVALLDRKDTYHPWAKKVIAEVSTPLLTCEAVISETCFLLRRLENGNRRPLQMMRRGVLVVPFRAEPEVETLENMMGKYANVPMSFADACLVRMAELSSRSTVLTVDKDFLIYRKNIHQRIPVLMP